MNGDSTLAGARRQIDPWLTSFPPGCMHKGEAVRRSCDADGLENVWLSKEKLMRQFKDELPFLFAGCVLPWRKTKQRGAGRALLGLCPVRACENEQGWLTEFGSAACSRLWFDRSEIEGRTKQRTIGVLVHRYEKGTEEG